MHAVEQGLHIGGFLAQMAAIVGHGATVAEGRGTSLRVRLTDFAVVVGFPYRGGPLAVQRSVDALHLGGLIGQRLAVDRRGVELRRPGPHHGSQEDAHSDEGEDRNEAFA